MVTKMRDSHLILTAAVSALCLSGSIFAQIAGQWPPPGANYIWISNSQIQALPDNGSAWNTLLADANRTFVPNVSHQDDNTDAYVLAAAMVWHRNGGMGPYRNKVRQACMDAAAFTPPAESDLYNLAWSRNLTGYVIAAGMVGLPAAEASTFRNWLAEALPHIRRVHRERPNNFGTHAGAARAAIAIYLGDAAEEVGSWDVLRRYLGELDPSNPFESYGPGWAKKEDRWGGTECFVSWQGEAWPNFFGINRPGTTALDCLNVARPVGGAIPDDQRRGDCNGCGWDCPMGIGSCCFTWASGMPVAPIKTNYAYETLQGVLAQAIIHDRRGRDPWSIAMDINGHGAILRAYEWLRDVAHHPITDTINGSDDYWQTYVINQVYSSASMFVPFDEPTGGTAGKAVGYAEWTTMSPNWP